MVYDVYVDGSYKNYGGDIGAYYSSAATISLQDEEKPLTILTKASSDELISMRNVAGEIIAVMMAFEHCLNVLKLKQEDKVRVFYDYAGIENWCKRKGSPGYWRAKNTITQAYSAYVNTIVRPRFEVEFHHVTGHTGNAGNELVDKLAKKAMDDHVAKLVKGQA